MTPGEASAKGNRLIIEHPEGGRRVAAHVFDLEGGGVAWMDSGWTDPLGTSHNAHQVTAPFAAFSMGWGATRDDGEEVFIEVDAKDQEPEGERDTAREVIRRSLGITTKN